MASIKRDQARILSPLTPWVFLTLFAVVVSGSSAVLASVSAPKEAPDVPAPVSANNPFVEKIIFPDTVLDASAEIFISVGLPLGHEFTEGMQLEYKIEQRQEGKSFLLKEGVLKKPAVDFPLKVKLKRNARAPRVTLVINLRIPYCSKKPPKMCKFKSIYAEQPVQLERGGPGRLDLVIPVYSS